MNCGVCQQIIRDDDLFKGHYVTYDAMKIHMWCPLPGPAVPGVAPAPAAMLPGPRPHGACCEVCRLTPNYGVTNGEQFRCVSCSGEKK